MPQRCRLTSGWGGDTTEVLRVSVALFDSTVAGARGEAVPLAVVLVQIMGPQVRANYSNLRPAQQKELDAALACPTLHIPGSPPASAGSTAAATSAGGARANKKVCAQPVACLRRVGCECSNCSASPASFSYSRSRTSLSTTPTPSRSATSGSAASSSSLPTGGGKAVRHTAGDVGGGDRTFGEGSVEASGLKASRVAPASTPPLSHVAPASTPPLSHTAPGSLNVHPVGGGDVHGVEGVDLLSALPPGWCESVMAQSKVGVCVNMKLVYASLWI